jgi:hypothetical protein
MKYIFVLCSDFVVLFWRVFFGIGWWYWNLNLRYLLGKHSTT